jgi:hypothetical protein
LLQVVLRGNRSVGGLCHIAKLAASALFDKHVM